MESLKQSYDAIKLKQMGESLFEKISSYLQSLEDGSNKVLNHVSPRDLRLVFDKNHDESYDDIIDRILYYSLHLHHPHNLGHQVGIPSNLSILGNLLEGVINSSTAVYETSTVGNVLDQIIIDRVLAKFGINSGGGFFTSGGTLGNLTALLAARSNLKSKLGNSYNHHKTCILVSEHAHYCIQKAMKTMGFDDDAIIKIKTNNKFQIQIEDLNQQYNNLIASGYEVMAVVGSACVTVTGSFDSIQKLSDFCDSRDIRLHVDAAHGGAAIFSKQYKSLLDGISRADSIVFDFHKMLGISACATAVLFKSYQDSYLAFNDDASYLFDQDNDDYRYDLGKRTYECTKPSRAISLYLLRDETLFENIVDHLYGLTSNCASIIQQHSEFELLSEPMSNILCFRYSGSRKNNNIDQINKMIRKCIVESGKFYIVQATVVDSYRLRLALMNPYTSVNDFCDLLDTINSIVDKS